MPQFDSKLTPQLPERVLIAGASVRAAAQSCQRAGISQIHAIDLFGDQDLPKNCHWQELSDYPNDILRLAENVEPAVFLFTGGIENHPEIIESVASRHSVIGCNNTILQRVRDPFLLQSICEEQNLAFPQSRREPPPETNGWLRKAFGGSGGLGVQLCSGESASGTDTSSYFQQRISGPLFSALFVGAPEHPPQLLGSMIQLSGLALLNAPPFGWCGNIGPVSFSHELNTQLKHVGQTLSREFGLVGLFGIDFIVHENRIWLLEVNPRYTGSVELWELATGRSAIQRHFAACRNELHTRHSRFANVPPPQAETPPTVEQPAGVSWQGVPIHTVNCVCAKLIVYAPEQTCVNWNRFEFQSHTSWVADIPQPATQVSAGQPVCSIISRGSNWQNCVKNLIHKANVVFRELPGGSPISADAI